jgi:hypothetical protein
MVETLAEHSRMFGFANAGKYYAQGEGWRWYDSSDWEADAGRIFAAAGGVQAAPAGGAPHAGP